MTVYQDAGTLSDGSWVVSSTLSQAGRSRTTACMRKHPQQSRSRLMVTSIKQTVLEIVCRDPGRGAIRVAEVADIGGVSMGSIYQYFENLENILLSVYDDVVIDSLRMSGTSEFTAADSDRLARRLGEVDVLFDRDYLNSRYRRHIGSNPCAHSALTTFVADFNACASYERTATPYWHTYLKTSG